MREDILGMLKNAIEHGGNPARIAQSLINSGYPSAEVQQALTHITSTMPQFPSQENQNNSNPITPQTIQQPVQKTTISITPPQSNNQQPTNYFSQNQQMPKPPVYQNTGIPQAPSPPQTPQFTIRPLPSTKQNTQGNGKLIFMIFIFLVLVGSLISVIIFKDKILDLIS